MRAYSLVVLLVINSIVNLMLNAQAEVAILRANYNEEGRKSAPNNLEAKRLPLLFERNQIWLEATVEDELGYFMLDTGAPTLLLANSNTFTNADGKVLGQGVHGGVQLQEHDVSSFKIGQQDQGPQLAYLLNLKHFSSRSGNKLLGMIGHEQIKNFELLFDLANDHLEFMSSRKSYLHEAEDPIHTFKFDYDQHLAILTLKSGKRRLRFAIDTGAGVNLLDVETATHLKELLMSGDTVNVAGLSGENAKRDYVQIPNLRLGELDFGDASFVLSDMAHLQSDDSRHIDGVIGLDMLKSLKFSINFKKQRFYVWEK